MSAWTLEALRGRADVTVLSWGPVALARVNRAFGTSLAPSDFRWEHLGPGPRGALAAVPLPLALLRINLLLRRARWLLARDGYDVVLSTMNEADVGMRAIQYVHYPWAFYPRPHADYRWYHHSPAMRAYRALSARVSGYSAEGVRRNLTLVNSDWTGRVFQACYGVQPVTLHPPVAGGFPEVPWEAREDAFVCAGRLAPEKELEKVIAILARVRARGHALRLRVVGHAQQRLYAARVRRAAAPHRDWISFHLDLSRDELVRLVARHRYGLHGMVGEHFGIAPAEMLRAGCIPFVPADGGPEEIVGGDERLIYRSPDDAVAKIDRMLRDAGLREDVRAGLEPQREQLSEQRFMRRIRELVDGFAP